MKPFVLLTLLFFTFSLAQAQEKWFDPALDPVAVQKDSSLHLLISEYVLAKSLEMRLEQSVRVQAVLRQKEPDGRQSLIFTGIYPDKNKQPFTLSLRLNPDRTSRFYFADNQAIVCYTPGCNNCQVVNHQCEGCCDQSTGQSVALIRPLVKVATGVE
ncbi:MAG TPA: hypothetical protein VK168_03140 [Saprospiraceae bacterium]|nr:hypothetical protein [Saprospiraceae bacterium]